MAQMRFRRVGDFAFGPQPTEAEFHSLPNQFAAVLNLRSTLEADYVAQDALLLTLGVPYAKVEWNLPNDITADMMARIFKEMDTLPKPVFVHCKVGFTAAWAVLLKFCKDHGHMAFDCLKMGIDSGFDFTSFVNMYELISKTLP